MVYNSEENEKKWNFEIGRLLDDDFTVVDKNAVEFEVQLENDKMTLEWINFMAIKEHWDKPYSSQFFCDESYVYKTNFGFEERLESDANHLQVQRCFSRKRDIETIYSDVNGNGTFTTQRSY